MGRRRAAVAAVAAIALVLGACSDSTTIEGSRTRPDPDDGSTEIAGDAAPIEAEPEADASERGTRAGADDPTPAETDAPDTTAGDEPPSTAVPQEVASLIFDGQPLAENVTDLASQWDRLNRELFEGGQANFQRVAAEAEQFSTAIQPDGTRVFSAALTENGVLGGSVDEQGRVIAMVTVATMNSARDAVVVLTSLEMIAGDDRDVLAEELAEVAGGPEGSQERIETADGTLVIERIGDTDSRVFLAYARGVTDSAIAALGGTIAEVLDAANGL